MKLINIDNRYFNAERLISIDVNEENGWARLSFDAEKSITISINDLERFLNFCGASTLRLVRWQPKAKSEQERVIPGYEDEGSENDYPDNYNPFID